ncbi:Thymidylate kinase, partial [Pseudolycoriella hygida]
MSTIKCGKFITFEGGEGCGKSTQSNMLYQYLLSKNIPVDLTREVGGTAAAEKMREILIHQELLPKSELLQIMAARYEHVHKRIIPKLNSGSWVICDRFIDSTAAYQGQYTSNNLEDKQLKDSKFDRFQTRECASSKVNIDLIYELHTSLISPIMPDYTFWIDLKPQIALSRAAARGNNDKFEDQNIDFHQQVHAKFQYISSQFLDRIVRIPIFTLSQEEIHAMIVK